MRAENVTFRNVLVEEFTNPIPGSTGAVPKDEGRSVEIIEITFPDGKVSAFPATDVNAETGKRYRDLYAAKYAAFKSGNPDPDRVAQLNSEIAERQAELDAGRKPTAKEAAAQAKADKEDRVASDAEANDRGLHNVHPEHRPKPRK